MRVTMARGEVDSAAGGRVSSMAWAASMRPLRAKFQAWDTTEAVCVGPALAVDCDMQAKADARCGVDTAGKRQRNTTKQRTEHEEATAYLHKGWHTNQFGSKPNEPSQACNKKASAASVPRSSPW